MYEQFYHFREKPFALTPDPEFLYQSRGHKRALAYLQYGVQDPSGFVCITGEIGAGKTTLIRVFLDELKEDVEIARIFNTKVSSRQLLEMILQDLGQKYRKKSKTEMINTLNQYLIDTYTRGKRVALVIDEAQNLSADLLEEIRLLSNLETAKTRLLQIILVGQSELRDHLQLPGLEQFRQRITVNYHIRPLNREETAAYIAHRIRIASEGPVVTFPEAVIDPIYEASGGLPRLINVISDTLLLYCFVEEMQEPNESVIQEVISDMTRDGTLRSPGESAHGQGHSLGVHGDGMTESEGLSERIEAVEKKLTGFEERLTNMIQNNGFFGRQEQKLLERLEEVHRREQRLVLQEEKLRSTETQLSRKEEGLRALLRNDKGRKKTRAKETE